MFNKFPYTDFHEMNLDWFLNKFNELLEEWATMQHNFDTLSEAFTDLKNFVNDYFANLDVQEEIDNKINEMAESGDLANIISPFILGMYSPSIVSNLADMTDPQKLYIYTGNNHIYQYINGAFVDTGLAYNVPANIVKGVNKFIAGNPITAPYDDLDTVPNNEVNIYGDFTGISHVPPNMTAGTVISFSSDVSEYAGAIQLCIGSYATQFYYRASWGSPASWGDWVSLSSGDVMTGMLFFSSSDVAGAPYNDLNTVPQNTIITYAAFSTNGVSNTPDGFIRGSVITFNHSLNAQNTANGKVQLVFNDGGSVAYRMYWANSWTSWNILPTPANLIKMGTLYRNTAGSDVYDDITTFPVNEYGIYTALYTGLLNAPELCVGGFGLLRFGESNRANGQIFQAYGGRSVSAETVYWAGTFRPWRYKYYDTPYSNLAVFDDLGIIGDSFANGSVYVNGVQHQQREVCWGRQLEKMNGNSVDIFANGGATTKSWLSNSWGLPALQAAGAKQLYIINLGINDANNLTLGQLSDIGTANDTFYRYYGNIITAIQAFAPNAYIWCVGLMRRNSGNYNAFTAAVKEIADYYGLPYIDPFEDYFFESYHFMSLMESSHPTALMYNGIARAINRLFGLVHIRYHDYFKTFLGT